MASKFELGLSLILVAALIQFAFAFLFIVSGFKASLRPVAGYGILAAWTLWEIALVVAAIMRFNKEGDYATGSSEAKNELYTRGMVLMAYLVISFLSIAFILLIGCFMLCKTRN